MQDFTVYLARDLIQDVSATEEGVERAGSAIALVVDEMPAAVPLAHRAFMGLVQIRRKATIGAAMPAVRAKDRRTFLVGSFCFIFFMLILLLPRLGVLSGQVSSLWPVLQHPALSAMTKQNIHSADTSAKLILAGTTR